MKVFTSTMIMVGLVGCATDDASALIEAQGPLGCQNQPLPTRAPRLLTVSGTTVDVVSNAPLDGVTVSAFAAGSATPLAVSVTGATGAYSVSTATNSVPITGYMEATRDGYQPTYVYAATPLYTSLPNTIVPLISSAALVATAHDAGVAAVPGQGSMLIRAVDCAGQPLAGATFSISPASEMRYSDGGAPSIELGMTDATGVAYAYNVAPGEVTIEATVGAAHLRSNVVRAFGDAATVAEVEP